MVSKTNLMFSAKPAYVANMIALIPRHWFVYFVAALVPFLIYINIDGGPNADDSGHYFTLWFLGVTYVSFGFGFILADLLNKPMLYCLPSQQRVLRQMAFATGLLVSLLFFVLGVLPAHSYWAPPTKLGMFSLLPIGLMFHLLIVFFTIRNVKATSWTLAVFAIAAALLNQVYFHGSGPDIVRPHGGIFVLLACASLVLIPICWKALGHKTLRRELLGTETLSSGDGDVVRQLETYNLFQRSIHDAAKAFSGTKSGALLLTKIGRVRPDSMKRPLFALLYRMGSANDPRKALGAWLFFTIFGAYLSFNIFNAFTPIILLYSLMLMAMFQGAMIFRRSSTPFLPQGRRATFLESLFNAFLRYLFIIAVFLAIYGLSFFAYRFWPDQTWSAFVPILLEVPLKSYLFCLLMAPLMLFVFHRSRAPGWLLFAAIFIWLTTYNSPYLAHEFIGLHAGLIAILMAAAWIPFVALNYLRSFKQDLK